MERYPLQWPLGYRRTSVRIDSRFKTSMDGAQEFLRNEIRRIGGFNLIVSTNVPTRSDGGLYADWMRRKIDDPGVAIYFTYRGKDVVMCCDQYLRVGDNVYALGKGIEALRGMDRWGVSDFINRAFTGFAMLTDGSAKENPWYEVLGVLPLANLHEIKEAYRKKAMSCHPDKGGSVEAFQRVSNAYNTALEIIKNK